jgi:hypothetical protein
MGIMNLENVIFQKKKIISNEKVVFKLDKLLVSGSCQGARLDCI